MQCLAQCGPQLSWLLGVMLTPVWKRGGRLGRKLGCQESLCHRCGRDLCSWLGGVWKKMEVEDREKIKGWDGEVAEVEGWIFWAHWRAVLRDIMRIWSQHFQINFGNSCVGTILMQPKSLNISNNRTGITNDEKQGECRQCSLLGRGLSLGSVWLSCHDSSPYHDPYCHRRSVSRHKDGLEEQKAEGAWDKRLFLSIHRPEQTCPGQIPRTVPRLGLIYVTAELAASMGSYVILLCGKIGKGGMERKRVNNRVAPSMSGPLFSTVWASHNACGGTRVSDSFTLEAQS